MKVKFIVYGFVWDDGTAHCFCKVFDSGKKAVKWHNKKEAQIAKTGKQYSLFIWTVE